MTQQANALPDATGAFVYDAPNNCWRRRRSDGCYDVSNEYSPEAVKALLMRSHHLDARQARDFVADYSNRIIIDGVDMRPNAHPIFRDDASGFLYLNTWVPPAVKPILGDWPTLSLVLDFLTSNNAEARKWVLHKLAMKYQNQAYLSKVAIVFATSHGVGKGVLSRALFEIFGAQNCATIQQGQVEGRFFARYASKLVVVANEIMTADNLRSISQKLKVYIDGNEIEAEDKYIRARTIRNRALWIFNSNEDVAPVEVERHDRRYTVLSNFNPPTPEYVAALNACFERDRTTMTPAFQAEVAAFAHYLLHLEVDTDFIAKPLENEDRKTLIEANRSGHEEFMTLVETEGDDVIRELLRFDSEFVEGRAREKPWDFGAKGIASTAIYAAYVKFCRANGYRPFRSGKFSMALKKRLPAWQHGEEYYGEKKNRRVVVYVPPHVLRNSLKRDDV